MELNDQCKMLADSTAAFFHKVIEANSPDNRTKVAVSDAIESLLDAQIESVKSGTPLPDSEEPIYLAFQKAFDGLYDIVTDLDKGTALEVLAQIRKSVSDEGAAAFIEALQDGTITLSDLEGKKNALPAREIGKRKKRT